MLEQLHENYKIIRCSDSAVDGTVSFFCIVMYFIENPTRMIDDWTYLVHFWQCNVVDGMHIFKSIVDRFSSFSYYNKI